MNKKNCINKIFSILLYIYSITIFMFNGEEENVKYIYVAYLTLLIFLFTNTIIKTKGLLYFNNSCKVMTIYFGFSLISIIWSPLYELTISRLFAFVLLLILCILCNNYFDKKKMVNYLIGALIIGGLFETIYCIKIYGIERLFYYILSGIRLEDIIINNVNTLSNTLVISIVATIATMLLKRKYYLLFILVPEMLVLMAFLSRTAIIALIISIFIIFSSYVRINKITRYPEYYLIMIMVTIFFLCFAYKLILGDSGVVARFEDLFSFFMGQGEGKAASLTTRSNFIMLGIQEFFEFPVTGRGFGCAGYILLQNYGHMTYLHNNFIEILASGGIIGFVLYYSCYIHLIKKHIKQMKKRVSLVTTISFATLCCELITQIGIVTYYSKVTWLAMILWFVVAEYGTKYEYFDF